MLANLYKTWVKPIYTDVSTFILDTLFPIHCIVCKTEGKFICNICLGKLAPVKNQICIVCKKPAAFGLTHTGCQTPHGADGLISFLDYHDENVSEILIQGKYNFLPGVYKQLGELLARKLSEFYPDLISGEELVYVAPIPLHPSRKRWRGFNQSEILCQTLAQVLPVLHTDVLVRNKPTKTQKDLKREQRLTNMENAFALSPLLFIPTEASGLRRGSGRGGIDLHNKNIILVDDVTTTGSTLLEAAKVLKRNGAAKVWCLTVARD